MNIGKSHMLRVRFCSASFAGRSSRVCEFPAQLNRWSIYFRHAALGAGAWRASVWFSGASCHLQSDRASCLSSRATGPALLLAASRQRSQAPGEWASEEPLAPPRRRRLSSSAPRNNGLAARWEPSRPPANLRASGGVIKFRPVRRLGRL